MHCIRVAVVQHHCCLVYRQCRAGALTLLRTRLDPPVGLQSIHAQMQYTTSSLGDFHVALEHQFQRRYYGLDRAHSTVSIQGQGTVHDANRAIKLTHWLSCTVPRSSWRGQAHPHATTHHAVVHIQSILRGIWSLHVRPYALIGSPPRTKVHL